MSAGAWLASRADRYRFLEVAMIVAVLGNAAAHGAASLATWTWSPGLLTGTLLWIPLALARSRDAVGNASPRAVSAGVMLGATTVIVTIVLLQAATP
jgi:hypothetical protein